MGINATRLFSVLYHRTLNIGRVMSPTLALIVQREAEIDAFKPVPFYAVTLDLPGFTAASARMDKKADAEQLKNTCQGGTVTVKQIECKAKTEKPPALYDLTPTACWGSRRSRRWTICKTSMKRSSAPIPGRTAVT